MNNKGQREELPGGWVHESIVAPLLRTLVIIALLSIALYGQPAGADGDTLVSKSKRLGAVGYIYDVQWGYRWVSHDSIVEWVVGGDITRAPKVTSYGLSSPGRNRPTAVDRALLDPFNEILSGDYLRFLYEVNPSPDGQQLLFVECLDEYGVIKWQVIRVKDRQKVLAYEKTPEQGGPGLSLPVWTCDSKSIAEFYCNESSAEMCIWSIAGITNNRREPITIPIRDWHQVMDTRRSVPTLMGFNKHGLGVVVAWDQYSREDILVYTVAGTSQTNGTRKYVVHPPDHGSVYEVVLSPDGDQLAWEVNVTEASSSKLAGASEVRSEVWTSRIDGTRMHFVGSMVTATPADGGGSDPAS